MSLENVKKIKWGIIGLGKIAHKFAADLALVEDATLYAVASRNLDKAKGFAQLYEVPFSFGSYSDLFAFKEVDILYIATPHNSHAELSIEAMKHGKHVLCEKPIALNYNDALRMVQVARETGQFFMEAFWTRFNPSIIEVKKLIAKNSIGQVRYINADFVFNAPNPEGTRMTELQLGGGALLDIGVYPVFLSYLLLGKPKEIIGTARFFETGADKQTSIIMSYEDAQAMLHCSFVSNSDGIAVISAENGSIELKPRWHETEGYTLIQNDQKKDFKISKIGKGYAHEIMECNRCIRENLNESSKWSHKNALELIEIVDAIGKQIGLSYQ